MARSSNIRPPTTASPSAQLLLRIIKRMELINATIDYLVSSNNLERLSPWEKSFTESLADQAAKNGVLSERQVEVLNNIYNKHSPAAIDAASSFKEQFKAEVDIRELWFSAIEYYEQNPPYYSSLVQTVRADKDFVPSQSLHKKLTENGYFQKWHFLINKEPDFLIGDLVQIRGERPNSTFIGCMQSHLNSRPILYRDWNKLKKEKHMLLVEDVCDFVWTLSKGSKLYKVMDVSGETPYSLYLEERHIKKAY